MAMESQKSGPTGGTEPQPRIDGYEIIERLGQGGTASVWKARQVSLQRFVVIKVLSEDFSRDVADVKQFRLEARLAANLKHPGIVQVYDFGQSQDDRRYFFVMEYISGYSVGEWMRRKKLLPESDALVVVHSVAAALRYAWESSRIVHCDLKPDNIMVDGDGTIKLTDLGLAQVVSNIGLAAGRPDEFVTGTPNYMSPEQVRGNVKLDCRSDIYALGITLYHMLTGKLPFVGPPAEVMEKQLYEPLPSPREANPDISAGAAQLMARMTAKLPEDRYQHWEEVLAATAALEKPAGPPAAPAAAPAPGNDAAVCQHCGYAIRANAAFCRHCGSRLQNAPSRDKINLRLRPAAAKPGPPPPATGKGTRAAAPRRPAAAPGSIPARHLSRRRRVWSANLMGNLRLVLSVGLLGFLGYCGYQRIVNDRDVIWPLRVKIQRACGEAWNKARLGMAEFFNRQPAPAPPAGAEDGAGAAFTAPSTRPESGAVRETPADASPPASGFWRPAHAKPAAAAAEQEQAQEYGRLLELCRNSMPRVGEKVVIDLQHQAAKREGILQEIGAAGLVIKIASGDLTVPYAVMAPEYRMRFFPEERARHLLQRAARAP